MTNRTKDIVFIWLVLGVIAFAIFALGFSIGKCYAEPIELSDVAVQNKYYTEQTIINEMNFQKMWEYTESMTEEEYSNTFLGGAKL